MLIEIGIITKHLLQTIKTKQYGKLEKKRRTNKVAVKMVSVFLRKIIKVLYVLPRNC